MAFAQEEQPREPFPDRSTRVFELVLPADHLLGDWGGVRPRLENAGVTPRLILVTNPAGNVRGGMSRGVTAPTSVEPSFLFDLERMVGLSGGSVFVSASVRWGESLSREHIGNVFGAQQIYGFQTWRLIDFSYQQRLFNDSVELRLGRFATTDDFMVSAYSCGLVSNAFCGNPFAILLNAPGMTAYTGAWAALVKVRPTDRSYVMAGVYNGDQETRADDRHGLDFSLNGPPFAITEIGYQVNGRPGDGPLIGNYKLGAWYDATRLANYRTGLEERGSWGAYFMFDQLLAALGEPGSNRGLGAFGSVTVGAQSELQPVPLYWTAGFSARGLVDSRPRDAISIGVGSGQFSKDLRNAQRSGRLPGPVKGQEAETVVEATYRVDLRDGAIFIQPDIQYILQPGGAPDARNAVVLGVQVGVHF